MAWNRHQRRFHFEKRGGGEAEIHEVRVLLLSKEATVSRHASTECRCGATILCLSLVATCGCELPLFCDGAMYEGRSHGIALDVVSVARGVPRLRYENGGDPDASWGILIRTGADASEAEGLEETAVLAYMRAYPMGRGAIGGYVMFGLGITRAAYRPPGAPVDDWDYDMGVYTFALGDKEAFGSFVVDVSVGVEHRAETAGMRSASFADVSVGVEF